MAAIAIPLALGAASIAFSAFQGHQQARAQQSAYDYQVQQAEAQATAERQYQQELVDDNERQRQENEARAIAHFNYQNLTEDQRLQQLKEILAEDTTELRKRGLRARGQVQAVQSTRGSTGQSAELVLMDIRAQEGSQRAQLEQQFEFEHQGSATRRRGFAIELEQNKAAVQPFIPGPIHVNRPMAPTLSPAGGAAIGAIGGALNAVPTFAIPTLRAFQASQITPSVSSPSFASTQATFSNPNFGGLGSS